MDTQNIWNVFNEEVYFFILKKVRNQRAAQDVFQNSFFKIHKYRSELREQDKLKAWVFQIVRNEISDYFKKESKYSLRLPAEKQTPIEDYQNICCFNRFIKALPADYKQVIELVYVQGKKQQEAAEVLNISLANAKARIRRAKELLKQNFNECCKYEINEEGKLVGEANCACCND